MSLPRTRVTLFVSTGRVACMGRVDSCDDSSKGLVFPVYVIEDDKRSRCDRRLIQLVTLVKWAGI